MKNKLVKRSFAEVIQEVRTDLTTTYLNIRSGQGIALKKADVTAICVGIVLAIILFAYTVPAFADATDIFAKAASFMKEYYLKIVGISTAATIFISAICLVWAIFTPTSKGASAPLEWMKRVWLIWIVLNLLSSILVIAKSLTAGNDIDLNEVFGG